WSGAAHTFHASTLPSKTTTSQLNGIDAKGNAVGDANSIGYLWPASGKLDKLAPPAKGKYSFASGVVSLTSGTKPDLVVGDSENATGNFAADSWTVPATATGKTIAPVVLPALPGTGNGQAMAANAKGWIVGSSSAHACLWINGQAHDLNSLIPANSGWSLTSASGIDTAGQIIG